MNNQLLGRAGLGEAGPTASIDAGLEAPQLPRAALLARDKAEEPIPSTEETGVVTQAKKRWKLLKHAVEATADFKDTIIRSPAPRRVSTGMLTMQMDTTSMLLGSANNVVLK
jgi:hypothetical protein